MLLTLRVEHVLVLGHKAVMTVVFVVPTWRGRGRETCAATGILGSGSHRRRPGAHRRGRGVGIRRRVHRGVVGVGRLHPAGLVGRGDVADTAGDRGCAVVGATAHIARDACADPRPPLGRQTHHRAGGVGTSGRRRVVRAAVRQTTRSHKGIRTDRARRSVARRPSAQRGTALSAAVSGRRTRCDGTGQIAQADHASAPRRHTDLAGRGGAEERRTDRGDRRRLARDLLQPLARRSVRVVARGGIRASGCTSDTRRLRGRGDRAGGDHRRRRRRR